MHVYLLFFIKKHFLPHLLSYNKKMYYICILNTHVH